MTTTLLSRLPGDIFTTFLRGTPIFAHGVAAVIQGPDTTPENKRHGEWLASPADFWNDGLGEWIHDGARSVKTSEIEVDLEAEIGRAVAAWWAISADNGSELYAAERGKLSVLCGLAESGKPMSPEQIDMLARLCLRLAGRTP